MQIQESKDLKRNFYAIFSDFWEGGVPETHQKTSLCCQCLLQYMSKGAVVLAALNLS